MSKIFLFIMNESGIFDDKIKAVKGYRALTGGCLKESKEFVELVQENRKVIKAIPVFGTVTNQQHAIELLKLGGIEAKDNYIESRKNIIVDIKSAASDAILCDQYDIAKQLITVLENNLSS